MPLLQHQARFGLNPALCIVAAYRMRDCSSPPLPALTIEIKETGASLGRYADCSLKHKFFALLIIIFGTLLFPNATVSSVRGRLQPPHGISIGPVVFALADGHDYNRQTHRPRYSVCSTRPHLCCACDAADKVITKNSVDDISGRAADSPSRLA